MANVYKINDLGPGFVYADNNGFISAQSSQIGFNATTLGNLSSATYFGYGTIPVSTATEINGLIMATDGVFTAIYVHHVGDILNVAGQTATYELRVNGSTQASVSGMATNGGNHTSSSTALTVSYFAGQIITIRITLSAGLTALLTNINIGLV